MNEAIITAIVGGACAIIAAIGTQAVNIIKAKKGNPKEKTESSNPVTQLLVKLTDIQQNVSKIERKMATIDNRLNKHISKTIEIGKSELRHEITNIYYQNLKKKTLDSRTKEDLCSLYSVYSDIGGNSFASEIYKEMMEWDIEE